jgi:hypothetical protein
LYSKQEGVFMSKKTVGIVALIIGIVIFVAALGADAIGVGGGSAIGWKQILGAVVGVAIGVVGMVLSRSPRPA